SFTVWPGISGTPGFNSTGFKLKIAGIVLYGGELIAPLTNLINGHASQVTAAPMKWSQECFGRKSTSSITNISFSLSEVTDKTSYIFSYDVNRARSYEGYDDLWMTVETTGGS
ncbi:hypothetical protein Tco_1544060, partial [Tanacetum coccineum]